MEPNPSAPDNVAGENPVEFSVATREILTENLSNTRSAITEIRQNLETIEAGRRRAEVKVKELTAELELERSERQRAQRDRAALAEKFDLMEKNLKEAATNGEELDTTRRRLAEIAKEKDQFQKALTEAEGQMTALKQQVAEVSSASEKYDARISALQQEVEQAQAAATSAEATSVELDAEKKKVTLFEQRLAKIQGENESISSELDAARAAYDHLSEELIVARQQTQEQDDTVAADLQAAREQQEDSEKKVVEMQAQLEAVNQSREVANLDLMIARKAIEELRALEPVPEGELS